MGKCPLLPSTLRNHVYRTVANPMAATPSAIIVCNIRPSTDKAPMAAFALATLVPDGPETLPVGLPAELLEMDVVKEYEYAGPTTDDDAVGDNDDVVVTTMLELEMAPELGPLLGGGLAMAGFVSAPVPQGIALPSG